MGSCKSSLKSSDAFQEEYILVFIHIELFKCTIVICLHNTFFLLNFLFS